MVVQNLVSQGYQSKEARLLVLKEKVEKVSDFIRSLRKGKSQVYNKIVSEVTGIEALVTLQSFLLQLSLFYRKTSSSKVLDIFEVSRAHQALSIYYEDKDLSDVIKYLREVKDLFNLVKEEE